jgi:hypothetical protein
MLDKNDRRYLKGSDPAAILGSIQGAAYQAGIQLQQTGPNMWVGRGAIGAYSLVPKLALTITPMQDGACVVDVGISADLESNGIIVLVVAWVLFFPVAVILAVLGYQDWERRAIWLKSVIWTPLAHLMITPPAPAFAPPMGGMPGPPRGPGYGPP